MTLPSPLVRGAAALALLVPAARGQEAFPPPAADAGTPTVAAEPRPSIPRELELALGRDHSWLAYRTPYTREPADGYLELQLLATEDEDVLLGGTILRWSELGEGSLWGAGIGFSAWAGLLDGPPDDFVSVALTGSAAYRIPTKLPMTASARVSYAPDITSFGDADGLTDLEGRLEVAVADSAVAFVAYRYFEVDLTGGGDVQLGDELVVGVRLGL